MRCSEAQGDIGEQDDAQRQHQRALGQGCQRPGAQGNANGPADQKSRQEVQPRSPRLLAETPDLPGIGGDQRKGHQPDGVLQAEDGGEHRQGNERQAHAGGALDHAAKRERQGHDDCRLQFHICPHAIWPFMLRRLTGSRNGHAVRTAL